MAAGRRTGGGAALLVGTEVAPPEGELEEHLGGTDSACTGADLDTAASPARLRGRSMPPP
ncbi:hypothetical protein [Kitasatospora sp. CB01950]|uniref:hypothetical protein n=1 Tax=Kitasatospora sp. CB01950 TaxID=1703930 RepID=UPI00093B9624|nr:hypothetical protein [Kitasatospora sp. CB01950]OKJ01137.1 hypothetical protein AMK19_28915 [Kitasatospora sp. CB01950]